MSIKIILADDHKLFRDGLFSLLDKHPGFEVLAQAADGREALELVRELLPNILVIDIAMPGMNGIEATKRIKNEYPNIKIIALSMHSDRQYIEGMLKAGASGYLLKDCAFEELINAIRTVVENHIYLSPKISDIVVSDYIQSSSENVIFSSLTLREREVLQLLAEGVCTKDIASKLCVSVKTIETHRHNIMSKLNLYSVAQLTKYAIRSGMTSLEH